MAGRENFSGVRLAAVSDAKKWGEIQAHAMRQLLVLSLPQVSPVLLEQIDPDVMAQTWRHAIAQPPSAKHHLLSAVDTAGIHGFAALAPASQIAVTYEPENCSPAPENPLVNQGA